MMQGRDPGRVLVSGYILPKKVVRVFRFPSFAAWEEQGRRSYKHLTGRRAMTATEYLGRYHDIWAWQDDWSRQWVKLRKYVSGCSGDPWSARTPIINGLISENPKKYNWSTDYFTVDTFWTIASKTVVRCYCGKGSPDDLNDMIWLAHRYGRIFNLNNQKSTAKTMQEYVHAYLGQDCNGFVGNYFGIDPNTSIRTYAGSRRKNVNEVQDNDVVVWYRPWRSSKKFGHIGVVDRVLNRSESTFQFQLVHWGRTDDDEGESEHRPDPFTVKLYKDTHGEIGDTGSTRIKGSLYFDLKEKSGTAKVFICPPPGPPNPRP
jgi:hypothetical protein